MTNKKLHTVNFVLGDYHGDGHGKYSENPFISNFSMDEISKAYEKSVEQTGIDFEFICSNYEEYEITPELIEQFLQHGLDLKTIIPQAFPSADNPYPDYDEETGKLSMNKDYFLLVLIEFIKLNLPTLSLEKIKYEVFPNFFGYGLFY
jgi:hypothetical protein